MVPDYQQMADNNQEKFMEALRMAMPEFHIVANMMQQTNVNPSILFYVMRHIAEIANGTGYGQVHILIEEGTVRFVKGEHSTKVNEPALKDK